jgi:hypothetical protein
MRRARPAAADSAHSCPGGVGPRRKLALFRTLVPSLGPLPPVRELALFGAMTPPIGFV